MPLATDLQIKTALQALRSGDKFKRVLVSPWLALKGEGLDLGNELRKIPIGNAERGPFKDYENISIVPPSKMQEALYSKLKSGAPLKQQFISSPSSMITGATLKLVRPVFNPTYVPPATPPDLSTTIYEKGAKETLRAWFTLHPISGDGTDAGFSWSYYLSEVDVNFLNVGIRITATMKVQVAHFTIGNIEGRASVTVEGLPYVDLKSHRIMIDPSTVKIDLTSNDPFIQILFEAIEAGINWAMDFAESLQDALNIDIPISPAAFKVDLPEFGGDTTIKVLGIQWTDDRVVVDGDVEFLKKPGIITLKYKGSFSKGTSGLFGDHKEEVVGGPVDVGCERVNDPRVWGRESGVNSGISWAKWENPNNQRDARLRIRCWYDAFSRITVHYEIYQIRVL